MALEAGTANKSKPTRSDKDETISTPGIVPHTELTGVDIAGYIKMVNGQNMMRVLIFRSDLGPGLYMEADLYDSSIQPVVRPMFPVMRNADQYFTTNSGHLYMIKGDEVAQMKIPEEGDTDPKEFSTFPLAENCRGGDHYIGCQDNYFVIIYQNRGEYRVVTNLQTGKGQEDYYLNDNYKKGIYYWGVEWPREKNTFFVLNQVDKWSRLPMAKTDNLAASAYNQLSFLVNLIDFLPGGTSLSLGPSRGTWSLVKSIGNDSKVDIKWDKGATVTVGYSQSVSQSIEHNWNVSASVSTSVSTWVSEVDISLSASYGGCSVNTKGEDWSQSHEVQESLEVTVEPHETVYLWQYKCDMGEETVLFTKSLATTTTNSPPTYDPLPKY